MEGMLLYKYFDRKMRFCFIKRSRLLRNPGDMQKRLWKRAGLFLGAMLGILEGGSLTGDFVR